MADVELKWQNVEKYLKVAIWHQQEVNTHNDNMTILFTYYITLLWESDIIKYFLYLLVLHWSAFAEKISTFHYLTEEITDVS